MVASVALPHPPELRRSSSLVPALKSNWLTMHVTVIMMSYASLLVGSLLSSGYLLLDQPADSLLGGLRDAPPSFRARGAGGEDRRGAWLPSGVRAGEGTAPVEERACENHHGLGR